MSHLFRTATRATGRALKRVLGYPFRVVMRWAVTAIEDVLENDLIDTVSPPRWRYPSPYLSREWTPAEYVLPDTEEGWDELEAEMRRVGQLPSCGRVSAYRTRCILEPGHEGQCEDDPRRPLRLVEPRTRPEEGQP